MLILQAKARTLCITVSAPQQLSTSEVCPLNDVSQNANATSSNVVNKGTSNVNPTNYDQASYIQLANGATYTFHYDACDEVNLVTYPSGGFTKYSYGGVTRPYFYSTSQPYYEVVSAAIHSIGEKDQCGSAVIPWGTTATPNPSTLNCPSGLATTTYGTSIGPNANVTMAVKTPDGVTTTHVNSSFYDVPSYYSNGTAFCCTATPVELSMSTGSGPATVQVATSFDTDGVHPKTVTTTLGDGSQSQVQYTNQQSSLSYNGKALLAGGPDSQIWDVQEKREYDYGSGAPGPLIRTTDDTWYTTGYVFGPNYFAHQKLTENLYAGPSKVLSSQTRYEYDNYGHYSSGMQSSGAVNHGGIALGSTTYGYSTSFTLRNNLTNISRWRSSDGLWLNSYLEYDDAGNTIAAQDAEAHTTNYTYTDNWQDSGCAPSGQSKAYLTSTSNALGQTTSASYNSCSGTTATTMDANKQTTTTTYDVLNRVTQVSYPDTGQVNTCFSEMGGTGCAQSSSVPLTETVTTKMNASQNEVEVDTADGLGRTTQTQLTSDPDGTDTATTSYDSMGRVACVSNPYRTTGDPTYGTTCTTYDPLGRKSVTAEQDSSKLSWSYSGPTTTYTDELSHLHVSTVDVLGHEKKVLEADQNNNPTLETDYIIDIFGELLQVDQWGGPAGSTGDRQRKFVFDSLSQLVSATNPESGTVTYQYAPSGGGLCSGEIGLPCVRTDARGVQTTYSYDTLNRLSQKSYTNEPAGQPVTQTARYTYDTPYFTFPNETDPVINNEAQTNLVGRQAILATNGNTSATAFGYDPMGRVILKSTCTPQNCGTDQYDTHYRYDLAGDLTFADRGLDNHKDASNPFQGYYYGGLSFGYNNAARLTTANSDISDGTHPASILSNAHYAPLGRVSSYTLGNFYQQTASYAPRAWMTSESFSLMSGGAVTAQSWQHNGNGTISQGTNAQNGSYTYGYDNLARLTSSAGSAGGVTYGYDAWGNMTSRGATGSVSTYQFSRAASANNQFGTTFGYDASGNIVNDGVHRYTWDAENRLLQVTDKGIQYVYDAEGNRVAEGSVGQTATTDFIYNLDNQLVTTVGSNSLLTRTSLYAGGMHLADFTQGSGVSAGAGRTEFRFVDQIGSLTLKKDQAGNLLEQCSAFPFGESLACSNGTDFTEDYFSDKKRDAESNLDDFGARYFASSMGRWMSPDRSDGPEAIPYGDLNDPQSLNLYAYVDNNPLSIVDSDGHEGSPVPDPIICYNGGACDPSFAAGNDPLGVKKLDTVIRIDVQGSILDPIEQSSIYQHAQSIGIQLQAAAASISAALSAINNFGRPSYVPQHYLQEPTQGPGGVKFVDPTNRGNMVRLMPGNPKSSNPAQQNPYTVVTKNGKHYDANGNKVVSGSEESHIPQGTENLPPDFFEGPIIVP